MLVDRIEELHRLGDGELDARLRSLELQRRRIDAESAMIIAVAEHRQVPAIDGHRSTNAYLRATLNCSSGEASRLRSLARAIDRVDGLGDAWAAGRFGVSQALVFARLYGNERVRDRLAEFVPLLLDDAERLSCSEFEMCAARFVALADRDGAHDQRDDAVEHRDARVCAVGGSLDVSAQGGDGVTAAEMIAIHHRFVEAEYRADLAARRDEFGADAEQQPLRRTGRQRRFDALLAIFRRAAAADSPGASAEVVVNVVVDASTFVDALTGAGLVPDRGALGDALLADLVGDVVAPADRRCETSTGIPVDPHDVLRAALAGHIRRVVVDSGGVVVDLGRRQRLFTGAARQAAMLLLVACEHPGCGRPAEWCDVDHGVEWADGGRTDQHNAGGLCPSHNTDKTRRRWRTRRDVLGRRHTIRADGTIMLPVGVRPPGFPDPDDEDEPTPAEIIAMHQRTRERVRALIAS